METAFAAIAAPRRRQILELVRGRELSAGAIAAHFEVSRPAISQHLRVLKAAGLLSERREGTKRLYRLRLEGFTGLHAYLDTFWTDNLRRLKAQAELDERVLRATMEGSRPQ